MPVPLPTRKKAHIEYQNNNIFQSDNSDFLNEI